MADRVSSAAAALAEAGLRRGDRVLVHARNSHALLETMWATWMLGGDLGADQLPSESDRGCLPRRKLGRDDPHFRRRFSRSRSSRRGGEPGDAGAIRHRRRKHGTGGCTDWETLAAGSQRIALPADVGRDEPCWYFYTSGSTGRPKAATLTHGQMQFVVTNHLCDLMPGTTERDVSLVVAPLSHGAGIHALTQAARGATSVLLRGERLDCAEAWQLVEQHRVTNMFTVPTILTMLTRHEDVDRVDHASLRYVIYAGAPMYRADQVHALRKLGPVLVQYFGLGEVTGNITVLPPALHSDADDDPLIGSCGYPRTGMEIAILDPSGARLAPGETGEICVRGPAVFAGYANNPAANEAGFAHGWFHTGDLGHLNARGFLFITGRASDMYISGGSNVYPREIEEALLTHPAVAEACVVGVPDERWGESGVAVLVLEAGQSASAEALLSHLDGRIARYKWPARFVFWSELPKSGYGKVAKRDVKQRLAETEEAK